MRTNPWIFVNCIRPFFTRLLCTSKGKGWGEEVWVCKKSKCSLDEPGSCHTGKHHCAKEIWKSCPLPSPLKHNFQLVIGQIEAEEPWYSEKLAGQWVHKSRAGERSAAISSRSDLREVTFLPCHRLAAGQWIPSTDCSNTQAHPEKARQASVITDPSGWCC